jgi:hypothetical protein
MTWRDVKAQREHHGLTQVQLSALALRNNWHITLDPYRITLKAGLNPAQWVRGQV